MWGKVFFKGLLVFANGLVLSHAGGFWGLYLNLIGQINTAVPSLWGAKMLMIFIL